MRFLGFSVNGGNKTAIWFAFIDIFDMDKFDILDTFDFLDTFESVENFDRVDMKSTSVSNESLSLFEYSNELRKELKRVDAVESTRVPSNDELVGE